MKYLLKILMRYSFELFIGRQHLGTERGIRERGGSRNLPYLNAKPRQIPLLGTYE